MLPPASCLSRALIFLVVVACAGCARRETPAEAGVKTRTLLVGNSAEPADLDPQIVTTLTDENIQMALFEGLTALDETTSQPVPAAAERWESSADGIVWTFHLRAGLEWSNGEALTAGDFVEAWHRTLTPALAAENAWYFNAVKNAEPFSTGKLADFAAVGLAAPDARTVVISLEHPVPYLPALVAQPSWFPVNPRVIKKFDAWSRRGSAWTRPGNHVSNGAFMLAEWEPNSRVVVAKNPRYWNAAQTQLARIVFFPIENPTVEENSFRAGQLHVTFSLPVGKIASWREHAPEQLRIDPTLQTVFLRFNTSKAPFDDPRIRRAFSLAIERDTLARTVLQGSRQPAPSLTPPSTGGYVAKAHVGTDFEAARQLLAAAGHPRGKKLPAIELQMLNNEIYPRLGEALQAAWQRELGAHVTLAPTEQKIWIQNQQSLNYSVTIAVWTADFPDPVTFLGLFTSDSAYNWTGWKNAGYDRLLSTAALTPDAARRYELFQNAEAVLLEDAPIAPVCFGAQTYLISPVVKGWASSLLIFRRYQFVHLEK